MRLEALTKEFGVQMVVSTRQSGIASRSAGSRSAGAGARGCVRLSGDAGALPVEVAPDAHLIAPAQAWLAGLARRALRVGRS